MVHGDVSPSLLYGPLKPNIKSCRLTGEQRESKEAGHLHVSHKHDRLSSVKIEFDEPLVRDRFLERIDKLPTQVFRIKGVIEFRGERGLKLFQSVAGRHDISEYKNPDFEERFLVCIGKNMESYISDPQSLRALLEGGTVQKEGYQGCFVRYLGQGTDGLMPVEQSKRD